MTTGMKWLTGCGIGCSMLALVVALLVLGGVTWFVGTVSDLRDSEPRKAV